jgi:hypothetical protein
LGKNQEFVIGYHQMVLGFRVVAISKQKISTDDLPAAHFSFYALKLANFC